MTGIFDRSCRVTAYQRVGGQQISVTVEMPLRIQFKVERNLKKEPGTLDLSLTNLKADTRAFFAKPGLVVQLEAGHANAPKLLFIGDVRYAASTYASTDWTTKVLAGDGAYAYANSRINRSYGSGTPALTVLRDCAASLGLALPPDVISDPALAAQFASGRSVSGWSRNSMTELLAPFGYTWSIQRNKLQILRDDQVRTDIAYAIDVPDGMIGTPDVGAPQKGLKKRSLVARVLLYPEISPGAVVKVTSRTIGATARAERVSHTGDTHGADWTTEVETTLR